MGKKCLNCDKVISYLCKDSKKDILLKYMHDWERRFLHIVKKRMGCLGQAFLFIGMVITWKQMLFIKKFV
ncbi:hypothetical protein CHH55_05645 [Niallia circulans]|uniref:Uncharacterized protein n=1 Tax=Niallia circulans TaxID=1397 RepID=A0A0J1L9R7_NIACI|nr:hypothetical protein ABW02_14860 [Niallia circulans]PAD88882.1 hypothetical protein CHH55_05645 [Niallia circulans]PAE13446.1 hypothetical protein CHI02_04305 [Niallia circulans]